MIVSNHRHVNFRNKDYWLVRQRLARQYVEADLAKAREYDLQSENNGAAEGQIYFVRLNGMVKVADGQRSSDRGSSPTARSHQILCHYPATRADKTLLHRQLRPYLAMGREWYPDCPLIADTVAGVIKQHGKPCIIPAWTTPKPDVVAGKRHSA